MQRAVREILLWYMICFGGLVLAVLPISYSNESHVAFKINIFINNSFWILDRVGHYSAAVKFCPCGHPEKLLQFMLKDTRTANNFISEKERRNCENVLKARRHSDDLTS